MADPWTPSTHIVQDGDTLPGLAARYLGDAARWPEILEANRDVLADPEALPVGIRLKLPASPRTPRSTGTVLQGPLVPVAPQIPNQAGASWAATGTPPGHASPRLPKAAGPVPP